MFYFSILTTIFIFFTLWLSLEIGLYDPTLLVVFRFIVINFLTTSTIYLIVKKIVSKNMFKFINTNLFKVLAAVLFLGWLSLTNIYYMITLYSVSISPSFTFFQLLTVFIIIYLNIKDSEKEKERDKIINHINETADKIFDKLK